MVGSINRRAEAADFNIRLATQYNPNQPIGIGYDRWAEAVTNRSQGRVAVRVFHNRTLIDSVESFASVKSGSVEASNMIAGFMTGDLPDLSALQLPFLFDDHAHYRRVLQAGAFDAIGKLYEKNNIRILNYFPKGSVHFYDRAKFLATPAAFKGENIRTVGGYQSRMVEILGASAVTLPGGEVMPALQRGVITGLITNFDGYIGYSWYRDAKYVFKIGAAEDGEGLGVNLALFNRMPPDLQAVLVQAAREMEDYEWNEIGRIDDRGGDEEKWKQLGLNVRIATADERAAFREALQPLYNSAKAE
ncbi:MAG: TRAP transporter substrate-binding protein, partial [Methylobacteriaceae bacterium]|nr:TRAP transporter substrate-binding protein [Methylobacteriaceae bacterium]